MDSLDVDVYYSRPMTLKRVNPLIWGCIAAGIGSGIVVAGQLVGEPTPSNELLRSPFSAAAVSFFWGWVAGNARNWHANRINPPQR